MAIFFVLLMSIQHMDGSWIMDMNKIIYIIYLSFFHVHQHTYGCQYIAFAVILFCHAVHCHYHSFHIDLCPIYASSIATQLSAKTTYLKIYSSKNCAKKLRYSTNSILSLSSKRDVAMAPHKHIHAHIYLMWEIPIVNSDKWIKKKCMEKIGTYMYTPKQNQKKK